jgi:protein-S-isoprenylcysteine O-methyltransferase Ste14
MFSINDSFSLALLVEFTLFVGIRRFFQLRLAQAQPKSEPQGPASDRLLVLIESIAFFGGVLLYLIAPQTIAWATLPLPLWVRWAGILLGAVSLAGLLWVHTALGKNWSAWLELKEGQTLVTHGPYRRVRHPMYTALYGLYIGWTLLTANWLLGAAWIVTFTLLTATRIRHEEAMMIERFGEVYREYMKKTGRFLPKS